MLDAYPDWQIPAHVITMVPTADRQKATVLVRIGFKALDPRILPDMGVKVTFLRATKRRRRLAKAAQVSTQPASQPSRAEGGGPHRKRPTASCSSSPGRSRRAAGGESGRRRRRSAGGRSPALRSGEQVIAPLPPDLKDGALVSVK